MTTHVLVIDDHAVVRAGLRAVLDAEPDLKVVGEADKGTTAVRLARKLRPDVAVTDLLLPDMDGVAVTESIRADLPYTQVVILTSVSEEDASVVRAIRAGAIGYVLKSAPIDALLQTVRAQLRARCTFRHGSRLDSFKRCDNPWTTCHSVSGSARSCARWRSVERTMKSRKSLNIAESTVKSHVRSVLDKLDVQSRTEAAFHALRSDVLSPAQLLAA